ncbi:hypothetical protein CH274_16600 [Rhodococcus sp. 06-418-5]|nr:hypothetical protein CH274_16600 [Rhodococcus sp. 06-418-5]
MIRITPTVRGLASMTTAPDTNDLTLHASLERAAKAHPHNLCLVVGEESCTYEQLFVDSCAAASYLHAHGVGPQSRVGLLVPNSFGAVQTLFACSSLGAVAVVLNTRFSSRELAHVLADSRIDTLVVSAMRNDRIDFVGQLTSALTELAHVDLGGPIDIESAPSLKRVLVRDVTSESEAPTSIVPEMLGTATGTDVALMIYTSGTTSLPKGCQLTHRSLVRGGHSIGRYRFELTAEDRLWDPLPFFHLSFVLPFLACVDAGAGFVTQLYFEPRAALQQIDRWGVTSAWPAFPAVTEALLDHSDYTEESLKNVRVMLNVAPPDALRKLQARTPHTVQVSAYGCSEGGGVSAVNEIDESLADRVLSQGRAFPGVDIAAMDSFTGRILEPGMVGELVIRGWGVFAGYWNDDARTGEVLDESGWLHTGDRGSVDELGRVTYRGRLKDMIKVGGENVAALEIESVLVSHPDVLVAAVVAVPHDRLIEVPAAAVELRTGAVFDAQMLLDHCRVSLARYKVPHYVVAKKTWPMSATKIQKYRLRDEMCVELGLESQSSAPA